jgi:hypothetical protein
MDNTLFMTTVSTQRDYLNDLKICLSRAGITRDDNDDPHDAYIRNTINTWLYEWETNLKLIVDSYHLYYAKRAGAKDNRKYIEYSFNLIAVHLRSTITNIADILLAELRKINSDPFSCPDSELKKAYTLVINVIFLPRLSLVKSNM